MISSAQRTSFLIRTLPDHGSNNMVYCADSPLQMGRTKDFAEWGLVALPGKHGQQGNVLGCVISEYKIYKIQVNTLCCYALWRSGTSLAIFDSNEQNQFHFSNNVSTSTKPKVMIWGDLERQASWFLHGLKGVPMWHGGLYESQLTKLK